MDEQQKEEIEEQLTPLEEGIIEREKVRLEFCKVYEELIQIFNHWIDLKEEYKNILALWVIGTYLHDKFDSYPILFINAMRGSGKTRLLGLLTALCGGLLTNSVTESVIFRTKGMIALDEFESIGNKDKQTLRELLNSGYKKGVKVVRMKEKKCVEGKSYEPEYFEIYRPIVMANINGIDDVLADRCIVVLQEKSSSEHKIRLMETFNSDFKITQIRTQLLELVYRCSVEWEKKGVIGWNDYINDKYGGVLLSTTLTTLTTLTTKIPLINTYNIYNIYNNTTLTTSLSTKSLTLYNKIDKYGISGRNLEIFFPLYLIADYLNPEILEYTLITSQKLVKLKKYEEETESPDVMLYDFVSRLDPLIYQMCYTPIKSLCEQFRIFSDVNDKQFDSEYNLKKFGKSLVRLGLILQKKRKADGIEILLDISKAKEKLKMFESKKEEK